MSDTNKRDPIPTAPALVVPLEGAPFVVPAVCPTCRAPMGIFAAPGVCPNAACPDSPYNYRNEGVTRGD